jgi:hypothetical protein
MGCKDLASSKMTGRFWVFFSKLAVIQLLLRFKELV